jgi:hypothetical protein
MGIQIKNTLCLHHLLFADDKVIYTVNFQEGTYAQLTVKEMAGQVFTDDLPMVHKGDLKVTYLIYSI